MAQVHGGRLVSKALARHGTTHLFTLCGGHIQAIYDGCLDDGIRVVDVRHEQTAGHAADGFARVTGRPGVCAVTAGPGITNAVTAVANADRAGVPMIVLGGAGPRPLQDMGSLQDMNAVELMRPITRWSASVPSIDRLQEYIDSAFRIAQANVPGPVFLELPLDLMLGWGDDLGPATASASVVPASRPGADPLLVDRVARMLRDAERPMFIVGSQLRWTPWSSRSVPVGVRLRALADAVEAPFYLSGLARGGLPCDHPCLMSRTRKLALGQTDLCLVLGAPFDFRLDYGRGIPATAKVVQVDLDGRELGRNRRVDLAIQGDSGIFIEQLLTEGGAKRTGAWLADLRAAEEVSRAEMAVEMASEASPPNPLRVCAELGARLGKHDVVVGDGGDFVATAASVLRIEWPQVWMDPGPLGALGVGPGFAMAAKLVRPEADVVLVYGDGSFGFHAMEFEAMVRQHIRVVAVIGNDAGWTQIRRGQVDLYGPGRAPATALEHTRYDKVVEALGGFGAYVERVEELGPALDAAFGAGKPACVNVRIGSSDLRKGALSV